MQPLEPPRSRLVATLRELRAAVLYLTGARVDPSEAGRGAAFFPVLGLAIGGVAAAAAWLGGRWFGSLGSAVLGTVALVAVCRGTQARALAVSASGSPQGEGDGSSGSLGGQLVLALAIAAKLAAIGLVPQQARPLAILLAAMLGRWAFVVQAYGSQPAAGDSVAEAFVRELKFNQFGVASVSAMALTLILADAFGLVLLLGVATQTVALRVLAHRRWGGVTEPSLAASAELGETFTLALGAGLARLLIGG